MRRILVLIGLLAGLWGGLFLGAQAAPPPPPAHWVTDGSNLLSPAVREGLDRRLQAYQAGHRPPGAGVDRRHAPAGIPWRTGPCGPSPPGRWAARAWTMAWCSSSSPGTTRSASKWAMAWRARCPTSWRRGSSGNRSCPGSRRGDADGALSDGVDRILKVVGGDASARAPRDHGRRGGQPIGLGAWIVIAVLGLALPGAGHHPSGHGRLAPVQPLFRGSRRRRR